MQRYNDLRFWQLSRVFCRDIYQITNSFSDSEKFGLVSLLRRASVSIPSNMAKSASKKSNKDFARFLTISLGSCYKIKTQILLSFDLNYHR